MPALRAPARPRRDEETGHEVRGAVVFNAPEALAPVLLEFFQEGKAARAGDAIK